MRGSYITTRLMSCNLYNANYDEFVYFTANITVMVSVTMCLLR